MSATSRVVPLPVPGGHESLRFYDVLSADGTRLRAWTNDADGPTVLLCNGLGTNPYAWPALLRPDCGVRVISWNHRGVGGSARPADRGPGRTWTRSSRTRSRCSTTPEVDACPVIGWSIGVNTAFELAVAAPRAGQRAVRRRGRARGTFASMGAPLHIPRWARRPLSIGVTTALVRTGWALTPVTSRLPIGPRRRRTCCGTAGSCCPAPTSPWSSGRSGSS